MDFIWILIGIVLALAVGGAFKWIFGKWGKPEMRVSWPEYGLGVICAFIVVPLTLVIGIGIIKADKLSFKEFWNGYEVSVESQSIECHEDGSCVHEYDCNPYIVEVDEEEWETRYHDCPYATYEYTYRIDTTLGQFTIASHIFAANPREWDGNGIPGSVPRGIPPFWQAAKDRIAAGDPGPVTKVAQYDNYILASQKTILKNSSAAVERLQKENLLPEPTQNAGDPIRDFYYADKISFVGLNGVTYSDDHPADDKPGWSLADKASFMGPNGVTGTSYEHEWSNALSRFNAALGTDLQGDLHMAVIDADVVSNPDEYGQAVLAWWQDPSFGNNAISKNSIIVVLGVDDGLVQWARAYTGMPYGNEAMLLDIQNGLKGAPFDPATVLGKPKASIRGEKVNVDTGDGLLAKIVWGLHAFERVCMLCDDEGEESSTSFAYLDDEIQASNSEKFVLVIISLMISTVVWAVLLFIPIGEARTSRYREMRHW